MDGALSRQRYLDSIADGAAAFAALLAGHPLSTPVPSCPGWDLADLGGHLGVVHRWALASLTSKVPPAEELPPAPEELVGWYAESATLLLTALRAADPDTACWGFGPPPRTVRFWVRRQAHEISVHAWDAAKAVGSAPVLDAELAADGIDEVAGVFYPRQVRLGRRPPLGTALALHCTDVAAVTVLGEGDPVARLSGPAELLLLGLWRRRDVGELLTSGAVDLDGDVAAGRAVLGEQLTP